MLNLLVQRGDGTLPLLKEDVSLHEAQELAGETACKLHHERWNVFVAEMKLDTKARMVPLCGYPPAPLVFRVIVRETGINAQDEDFWEKRTETEDFLRHASGQQGHEVTGRILLPVGLSILLAVFYLWFHGSRITTSEFANAGAFLLLIAITLYAILHEYSPAGEYIENLVASNGCIVSVVLAACVWILVYLGWRWGVLGSEPARELTRTRLLKGKMRERIDRRRYWRFIPLIAFVVLVGTLAWIWSEGTWEKLCVYQDLYIPPDYSEKLLR